MKWISVKDRLPELLEVSKWVNRIYSESIPVLITNGNNMTYVAKLAGYNDGTVYEWDVEVEGIDSCCSGSCLSKDIVITHWMPLPQGPNDE